MMVMGEMCNHTDRDTYLSLLDDYAAVSALAGTQRHLMTYLFARCARAVRPGRRFVSVFPKCYTVISSRHSSGKRAGRVATSAPGTGGSSEALGDVETLCGIRNLALYT
jgi:hypothetical protein